MQMKHRNIYILFIVCCLLFLWMFSAVAAETRVYVEAVSAAAGSEVLCPVRIQGNPGLMGFKLTFTYDSAVLTPVSVQKGEVTQSGLLDDSIGASSPGSFEVIWSHSANVKADGVLMTLVFRTAPTVPDNTEIRIEVSQPDTFNEQWEDVPLQCEPIRVSFADEAVQTTAGVLSAVTQDDVRYAVDSALQSRNAQSIADVEDQNDFLRTVNENIRSATGNADYFSNTDALSDSYTQAVRENYLSEVQQSVDGDKILLSIDSALVEVGAGTVEEVPADKQADFVQAAEAQLAQYMVEAPEFSAHLDTETALDTIRELQEQVAQDVDDSVPAPVEDHVVNHVLVISLCVCAAAILAAGIAAAIHIKKKKLKNEEET